MKGKVEDVAEGSSSRQDEAAAWFAAVRAGIMLVDQREAFERWRSDPRNQAAYDAMEELWDDLAVLKGEGPKPKASNSPLKLLAVAAALVIVLGVSAASLMGWFSDPSIQTAIGQQKTQPLPDGTLLAVNVDSTLSYAFRDDHRLVRITNGEAAFTVKADVARPFVVDAGDYQIRAVGTAFNVKNRNQQIEVAVSEGKVDICSATGDVLASLGAGQMLRFPADRADLNFSGLTPTNIAPAQISEWRMRVVTYENATVEEVVADFNRYFIQELRVDGSELADRRITIRLQVEQRDKAVQLLASLLNAQVVKDAKGETLTE